MPTRRCMRRSSQASCRRGAADRGGAGRAARVQPRRRPRRALCASGTRARGARAQPRRPRPARSRVEEAVEILEAARRSESLAAGYAALRRTDAEAGELRALVADMERLRARASCWRCRSATPRMHRRILEISGHAVAQRHLRAAALAGRPLPVRTVLAPAARRSRSCRAPAIVDAIAAGDRRRAAERRCASTSTNVAAALTAVAAPEPLAL